MTYRNKTDLEMFVPGVGVIAPHAEFESEKEVINDNFEAISSQPKVASVPPVSPVVNEKKEVTA